MKKQILLFHREQKMRNQRRIWQELFPGSVRDRAHGFGSFVICKYDHLTGKVFNVSMEPTLKEQDLLLVNKLAYRFGEPKHGDIIVFHFNGGDQDDYIKRVIGLPGDLVEIQGGVVRVNGQALTEPYIMDMPTYNGTWEVPPDELFVLGDNRNHSSDSHQWGTVKMEWVVGKALLVYWPPNKVKLLTIPDLVTAHPDLVYF